jgi:hypothetical protein
MIRESVIDSALNRLQAHFGKRMIARPPASAAELARLESTVGPLPRDLTIFLSTCNGLRVNLQSGGADARLRCIHEIESALRGVADPASASGLAPISGDPRPEQDWIVLEAGPAHGRLVRWNPWTPSAALLASSFGLYLESWAEFLIECFDADGRPRVGCVLPRFDAAYIARRDPNVTALRQEPALVAWLHQLELAVPTGDDCE